MRLVAALAAVAVLGAGCTSDGDDASSPSIPGADAPRTLEARGGTEQIWLRTDPEVEVALYDAAGEVVPTEVLASFGELEAADARTTDANGALVMRYVPAGEGYVVRRTDGSEQSEPITVTAPDDHPDAEFYESQDLVDGYQYLTTRDGTKLAINVTLPGPIEDGPYPTVIEYSGYDPANPDASLVTISKQLAAGQGFASVGVNIRGSGCSGGSFQLWEDAQAIDGYDVVETVAAQDWVLNNEVGMVGISYPASAMLYTASTQPPSLAAIAPMAAYDDGFRALLWPGGIQNKGFARAWIEERHAQAEPAAVEWAKKRIDEGDETCAENMEMRGQNVDLAGLIDVLPFFPEVKGLGDSFAPITFVDRVEVPTFMVASWQDEQVGGHAPSMVPAFTGVPEDDLYVTLTNGYHAEGLANPTILQQWMQFLQLYVAREVPDTTALASLYKLVAGQVIGDAEAVADMPIPSERFAPEAGYEEALAEFRSNPTVRVLFEHGGSTEAQPGVPVAAFEEGFDSFPVPGTEATTWYLGADGTLVTDAPTAADDSDGSIDTYESDPADRPEVSLLDGEDPWWRLPKYDWQVPSEGKALTYTSAPLDDDVVMVGTASADLWLRSSEADTDLQVTLSEVRPDGIETYIHSGWLRASKRKLDEERSTELQPLVTQLEADAEPLPEGEFVPVRVEVHPFAHPFRAGSRIRVTITAPGADRPVWSFVTLDGTQTNEIARSEGRPSAIVLPVVPGIDIPTALPACPSLRGQPCREVAAG